MFTILNHVNILINDLKHIFSKHHGNKESFRLLFTNFRLKSKQKYFELFGIEKHHEKFFGMKIAFPDYGWFCHLWREIFILENYYFESKNTKPYIIDAGSNIGMSIYYFKFLYPSSRIVAFEPDPQAFNFLKKNIRQNNFKDVTIHNIALGPNTGTITLYQDPIVEASGINTTKVRYASFGDKEKGVEVEMKPLSLFLDAATIDLLKIDIEGAEYEVFEELRNKPNTIKRIFLELHQSDDFKNEAIPMILTDLNNKGFRYAVTSTFISHHDFIIKPQASYAIMIDAEVI